MPKLLKRLYALYSKKLGRYDCLLDQPAVYKQRKWAEQRLTLLKKRERWEIVVFEQVG